MKHYYPRGSVGRYVQSCRCRTQDKKDCRHARALLRRFADFTAKFFEDHDTEIRDMVYTIHPSNLKALEDGDG